VTGRGCRAVEGNRNPGVTACETRGDLEITFCDARSSESPCIVKRARRSSRPGPPAIVHVSQPFAAKLGSRRVRAGRPPPGCYRVLVLTESSDAALRHPTAYRGLLAWRSMNSTRSSAAPELDGSSSSRRARLCEAILFGPRAIEIDAPRSHRVAQSPSKVLQNKARVGPFGCPFGVPRPSAGEIVVPAHGGAPRASSLVTRFVDLDEHVDGRSIDLKL